MKTNALSEEIFDLTVDGAEILFCPRGQFIIKRRRQAKRDLLFRGIGHDGYNRRLFFVPLECAMLSLLV